jgi:ABC-type transporter Mla MlaB component
LAINQTQLWKSQKFTIERIEDEARGVLIFRFTGGFAANDMYSVLKPLAVVNIFEFEPAPGKERPLLNIFDITEVPTLDSSGLGLIISHFIRSRARGVRVVAVGVRPNVLQLFKFTKVDALIPMAATVEEAIAVPRA